MTNPGQTIQDVNFNLVPNKATVTGIVRSSSGDLLRNATVSAIDVDNQSNRSATTTTISGEFTIKVPAGRRYMLNVRKDGYSEAKSDLGLLQAGSTITRNVSLTALPSSVAGTVRDLNGNPVEGAVVRFGNDSTITSHLGKYTLYLPAGNLTLTAVRPGYRSASKAITLAPGQNLTGVDFQLESVFARLQGTVASAGTFLEGVVVSVVGAPGSATATTNSQGRFSVNNLVPGMYTMALQKNGYVRKDTSLALGEKADLNLALTLQRLTGSLAGSVTANGSPVAEVTVQATSTEGTYTAITDASGSFELQGLPKVPYRVRAFRSGYTSPPEITDVTPDRTDLSFELIPNKARLTGVIKHNDVVLENVSVQVQGVNGNTGSGQSGANGVFAIENLAADTYRITARRNGYAMVEDSLVVSLGPGDADSVVIQMVPMSLSLAGRVLANGSGLAGIPVQLRNASITRSTTTGENGGFSFGGLQPGETYTVATNIFKPGYSEADTTVQLGSSNLSGIDLHIVVAAAEIYGTVGLSSVSISAERQDGRTFSALSNSDGSYSISLLPAGTYTVTVSRAGYSADPPQRQVTVSATGRAEANFTLTPNTGTIQGTVTLQGGGPIAGVAITAVAEGHAPLTTSTRENGSYRLVDIPAGRTYTVRAELEGYQVTPLQHSLQLQKGQVLTADFTLKHNTSSIRGIVKTTQGQPIREVLVSLQNQETGQVQTSKTGDDGAFEFDKLAAGQYRLDASKGGYSLASGDTAVVLQSGESRTVELRMESQTGTLRGVVRYRGRSVPNAVITAVGPTEMQATTDAEGRFTLAFLPQGSYELHASRETFPAIAVPGVEVQKGSDRLLPLAFPGGRIVWKVTDGVQPLAGARLEVTPPQSQPLVITDAGRELFRGELRLESTGTLHLQTDSQGRAATDSLQPAGTYYVILKKSGYLIPKAEFLKVQLGEDEFKTVVVPLVFRHTPVASANARDSIRIVLHYTDTLPRERVLSPKLWVKRIGADGFVEKPMQATGDGYEAWIAPHLQSGKVQYYLTSRYDTGSQIWEYTSDTYTISLNSKGILYRVHIAPGGGILQKGARVKLVARPVDDTGANLAGDVAERGTVQWQVVTGDSSARLEVDAGDPFRAAMWPLIEGRVTIRVTSTLDGLTKVGEVTFTSKEMELADIEIQAPTQASNDEPIQLSFMATSTDSQSMRLDSQWQVDPPFAGTINENGLFQPADNFFGDVTVSLIDLTSGKKESVVINLFANVDSTTERTFVDGTGLQLRFRRNAVTRRRQISLRKPTLPEVKKFTRRYQVIGDVYQLLPVGATFQKAPELILPRAATPLQGEPVIGWWEQTRLQWQPLQSTATDSMVAAFVEKFAQFAVLIENEPLGIHGLSFLPSPFSPRRGVMRIGYVLTSDEGQALVTIRIYNMNGDLVRTLLDRQIQYPGAHTELSLAWDGTTDEGKLARNGRYLVEIIAEQAGKQVRQVATVVLIK